MAPKVTHTRDLDAPIPDLIPPGSGIGLKTQHMAELLERGPGDCAWVEVHSENYFAPGGSEIRQLLDVRASFPVSLHGVGLSLGSAGPLDRDHLAKLNRLNRLIQPGLVSEHLSWSIHEGDYLNDLIPLPYTIEALDNFCLHVDEMQDALGRQVLIENPSSYMRYEHSTISETDFLMAVVERTGCGVLLDVNNVYVSTHNLGGDARAYIDAIPGHVIGEIHLGGHHDAEVDGEVLKIDDHGSKVRGEVWDLYAHAITRFDPKPTLIEWDSDVPELDVLLGEARLASGHLRTKANGYSHKEVRHAVAI
ncbi:DUF692 domain-containing protein [Pseudomonadota bacterium]